MLVKLTPGVRRDAIHLLPFVAGRMPAIHMNSIQNPHKPNKKRGISLPSGQIEAHPRLNFPARVQSAVIKRGTTDRSLTEHMIDKETHYKKLPTHSTEWNCIRLLGIPVTFELRSVRVSLRDNSNAQGNKTLTDDIPHKRGPLSGED